jgi:hypothetical protein
MSSDQPLLVIHETTIEGIQGIGRERRLRPFTLDDEPLTLQIVSHTLRQVVLVLDIRRNQCLTRLLFLPPAEPIVFAQLALRQVSGI